jgi:hypothetical protein
MYCLQVVNNKNFKFYFKGECVCSINTVKFQRVFRVPGFLSSRPNWVPPPTSECCPPVGSTGETHSLAREGVSEPKSDEGTDTLVLYSMYYNIIPLR